MANVNITTPRLASALGGCLSVIGNSVAAILL
jgi:hypothetical protein